VLPANGAVHPDAWESEPGAASKVPFHLFGTYETIRNAGRPVTRAEIAKASGASLSTTTGHLVQLWKLGVLKRIGNKPKCAYEVDDGKGDLEKPDLRAQAIDAAHKRASAEFRALSPAAMRERMQGAGVLPVEKVVATDLGPNVASILAVLTAAGKPLRCKEIAKRVKLGRHWTGEVLVKLVAAKQIVRTGSRRSYLYSLADQLAPAAPKDGSRFTSPEYLSTRDVWVDRIAEKVMPVLAANPGALLTTDDVARELDKSNTYVLYGLQRLVKNGKADRVRHGQLVRYRVKASRDPSWS
jgi:predicted transcriptional regulator